MGGSALSLLILLVLTWPSEVGARSTGTWKRTGNDVAEAKNSGTRQLVRTPDEREPGSSVKRGTDATASSWHRDGRDTNQQNHNTERQRREEVVFLTMKNGPREQWFTNDKRNVEEKAQEAEVERNAACCRPPTEDKNIVPVKKRKFDEGEVGTKSDIDAYKRRSAVAKQHNSRGETKKKAADSQPPSHRVTFSSESGVARKPDLERELEILTEREKPESESDSENVVDPTDTSNDIVIILHNRNNKERKQEKHILGRDTGSRSPDCNDCSPRSQDLGKEDILNRRDQEPNVIGSRATAPEVMGLRARERDVIGSRSSEPAVIGRREEDPFLLIDLEPVASRRALKARSSMNEACVMHYDEREQTWCCSVCKYCGEPRVERC